MKFSETTFAMNRLLPTLFALLFATVISRAAQPNLLWFIVDDMSANFSCYGEKLIQTPHVDRLAREGRGSAARSSLRLFARRAARRSSRGCIKPPSARITTAAGAARSRFTGPLA